MFANALERDDVLHGFFYGSEPLMGLDAADDFISAENQKLQAAPDARPYELTDVAERRFLAFAERLEARLDELQSTGQPELPRLVGHTLRLLSLLRDSWRPIPAPALEKSREPSQLRLWLYGEPYARYTLQTSLNLTNWSDTAVTNLRNSDKPITSTSVTNAIIPLTGDLQRYYRGLLPPP